MRALHGLAPAILVVVSLGLASAAHAAPSASDRETARTLMDQGRELRDKGNMKEAMKRFQAANDIMHVPTTAIELARAQVALGLLVEARDTAAGVRQMPAKNESALFKEARQRAEELDASLSGRVPAVTVTVKAGTPGEELDITIDALAVPSGILGLPHSVNPGHHVVTARTAKAEGSQEFDVREGEQKAIELDLIATAAPAVAMGPSSTPVLEGPPKKSHKPTALTFVGIGVAGAGAIAGAVTGFVSMSKKSTLTSQCTNGICGPTLWNTIDQANMFATISDVSFAVAGAGAVLAVVTLVVGHKETTHPPPPPAAWTVTPWISGGAAGLTGSF